jgi:hypothetical protein
LYETLVGALCLGACLIAVCLGWTAVTAVASGACAGFPVTGYVAYDVLNCYVKLHLPTLSTCFLQSAVHCTVFAIYSIELLSCVHQGSSRAAMLLCRVALNSCAWIACNISSQTCPTYLFGVVRSLPARCCGGSSACCCGLNTQHVCTYAQLVRAG